ncbi:hypothetical protein [Halovenus marina]|uniref:glycoside hydrolase family 38 N-terminal domain-containing protein n=1 Tax=Halovenus marina TaxID=3396621 RepID=UPI003F565EC5
MSKLESIKLVHHCHTDIGYTHDQPVLWDLQRRFIDQALTITWNERQRDDPGAFKWTVETTAPLLLWLDTASSEQIRKFEELENMGRIEVMATFANITPNYGPAQTVESLRPVRYLREEYDFDVQYGMNCDVNGQNWPFADALLDADIRGFSMGINEHFGGIPFERPKAFKWKAPSGRELLSFNGFHYSTGMQLGIGHDEEYLEETGVPLLERLTDESGYQLPSLLVQSYHPFGDNGPAYAQFSDFIRSWNTRDGVEAGELPSLEMITPAEWWSTVEAHADDLPTYEGDWTDFWNFGSISSAAEVAVNRKSRRRLHSADAVEAGLSAIDAGQADREPSRRSAPGTRSDAWWAVNLFDEHTWGADTAVSVPDGDDARSQWYHKANYAHDGRSLSQMLQRDGLAELSRRVDHEGGEEA